jgi:8-oxo-dGTP pyrophosphatase MutT (NUDIX family)
MRTSQIQKTTVKSVTAFVHCDDHYLFIHRTKKGNAVDFGRLNGVGGKLEPGENYLDCCIREVVEETGYQLQSADCSLAVVATLSGGYEDDWVMCFFSCQVATTTVPKGMINSEGELLWLPANQVLKSGYELVDDLNYLWDDIVAQSGTIFFSAQLDEHQKIVSYTKNVLPEHS